MTGAIGTHAIGVSAIGARDSVSSASPVIGSMVDQLIRWRRHCRR